MGAWTGYPPLQSSARFSVPLANTKRVDRWPVASELAEALLKGPDYLYPLGWGTTPGIPWYVRTVELLAQSVGVKAPFAGFQVYEVTNAGMSRRRLPVLRRVALPRWDFVVKARDSGVFDMSMLDAEYFRITRAQTDKFDLACDKLLAAYRRSAVSRRAGVHTPIMRRERAARWKMLREVRPTFHVYDEGLRIVWNTGSSPAFDRAMDELWSLAESICAPRARITDWREGYEVPPDRFPRLWAADLRRKARKSRSRE